MFRGRVRQVHFIGVGGVGMCGLAEILNNMEFEVTGSDLKENDNGRRLARAGVTVHIGHHERNVRGADVVVYSSAIKEDNPEIIEARRTHTPVIPRAEMLAELMRVKYGVALAGTHGKTTTTSLVATVLRAAGLDPTVVVGGRMASLGSNAQLGAGDLLVAEADESDGSFLRLTPTIACITNIDPEHLDHYASYEALKDAFVQFAEKVPFYGLAVLCLDHPTVQEVLPRIRRRHTTYGMSPQADYCAKNVRYHGISTTFDVFHHGKPFGQFTVRMPGEHNVLNTLAAVAIADELEVPLDVIKESLGQFGGVARRFTITAEPRGIALVDDYGHHPAEVAATLTAARRAYPGRVIVVFQPHRFSRTKQLFNEFTRSFNDADLLYVCDVYAAGEKPIDGASAGSLVAAMSRHGHHSATYVPSYSDVPELVKKEAQPGDVVLSLGAGDINKVLPMIERALQDASDDETGHHTDGQ